MSWDYMENKGFYFYEENYDEGPECPNCGSFNTVVNKVLEDTDADGRRGRLVNYLKCYSCGYDEN